MKSYYSSRVKLGVISLILYALLFNLISLKEECRHIRDFRGIDPITLYEKRFEDLRKSLQAQRIVGYITDRRPEEITGNVDALQGYYLTQYALAPVIVDNSSEHNLVVGNFSQPATKCVFPKNRDFIIYKDFGNGVLLFKTKVR